MVHGCSTAVLRRKRYADVSTGECSYVQRCYGYITVLYYWKENTCRNYSLYDQTWKSIERKGKWVVWRFHWLLLDSVHTQCKLPLTAAYVKLFKSFCNFCNCNNPEVEINPQAHGFEVSPLPVGMFSLSSWASIKHKSFTDGYPCASALPLASCHASSAVFSLLFFLSCQIK